MQHDTFSRNTRAQLKQVFDTLRELMMPPEPPKRPIGFVTPEDTRAARRPREHEARLEPAPHSSEYPSPSDQKNFSSPTG